MRFPLGLLALAVWPQVLTAQGLTTAAIQGSVVDSGGSPIAGASVRVINTSNGRRWEITTPSSGRYALDGVAIGGPYRIEVRALGFVPEVRDGIVLALGQRVVSDFALQAAAVQLSPVTVTAAANPVLNPGRTGPAEVISAAKISELPNFGRDLVTLTLQSPQVAISPSVRFANEAVTIAGQSRQLNSFQVDGGVNYDLYTGRTQPGLQTWPRPISLETLEDIQVLVAPFDVRYGGFAGGLVNAVTKSGTNEIRGSMFGFLSNEALVGRNATGTTLGDFTAFEFGGSIGGPIVRDRMHYFFSADVYRRTIADAGPLITDTAAGADLARVGIRYSSATRFQDILRNTYALDPGTLGPYEGRAPAVDVFGKATAQLGTNSHLELSHHYTDGERRTFIVREFGVYRLSSVGQRVPATRNATRLVWSSVLGGRWSNELIASYLRSSDACLPNASYPLIRVRAVEGGMLVAGTNVTCPSSTAQGAFEITENITVGFAGHLFTLGAHAAALRFEDTQLQSGAGLWDFRHLDSLEAGRASHYERTLPGQARGHGIEFRAREIGLYVQDRWNPTRDVTLTAGLRFDVSFLPDAVSTNDELKSALGVDTGRLPSGRPLWSPRVGVNYDVRGDGRTFLRGGIGLFSGRLAYSWVASSYRDNGLQELFLSCDGAAVPQFDPISQPTSCGNGAGPTQRLSFFDRNVRFPQSLKASVGVDHRLPGDIVGTLDLIYTRAQHQLYFSDANLLSPMGAAHGEGNRPLYGTISAAGFATTARRTAPGPTALGQVVRASDRSGDHSSSVAVQLRRRIADRGEVSALYARTRARDRMSVINFLSRPNLEATPLDGTLEDRRLTTALFEIPHRVEASASLRLPYRVRLSLRYAGASGTPYTYTVRGDANADGIGVGGMTNDIVYVPRNRADISIDANGTAAGFGTVAQQDSVYDNIIDPLIEREPCLRRQRGRLLERNSCRNPWFGTLNARVTKALRTVPGQSLELTADVYNVLNLLSRDWGQHRVTTLDGSLPMLFLAGYDASTGRGIYRPQLPGFRQIQDLASRWQVELGVRYSF